MPFEQGFALWVSFEVGTTISLGEIFDPKPVFENILLFLFSLTMHPLLGMKN